LRYRGKNAAIYLKKVIDLIDRKIEFEEKQIFAEQNVSGCPFQNQAISKINLQWTAKKTDLIELLYALHDAGCFNSGKVSLNQIATNFEKAFNCDLSHFSRDFNEMRIRLDKTPFIDKLKNCLTDRMKAPKKWYKKP